MLSVSAGLMSTAPRNGGEGDISSSGACTRHGAVREQGAVACSHRSEREERGGERGGDSTFEAGRRAPASPSFPTLLFKKIRIRLSGAPAGQT
eukprot:scaffold253030_cov37-Tisochrysis_lutea.AAC.3